MKKSLLTLSLFALAACTHLTDTTSPQAASQQGAWNNQYGGANKSYDQQLITMREQIAPCFQQLSFKDSVTGKTMAYNLYTPKNLDPNKKYPLVMFIADASTVGKGVQAPLMQGYGGIIWATDEAQAKHPAFVLVPAFSGPQSAVNDDWQTTDEVGIALRLLKHTIASQPIDSKRVYTTGQSMGGMISFYLNITEPQLFAASMFVGSQWNTAVLEPLKNTKFIYTVAEGDPKASKGMAELKALFEAKKIPFDSTEFSAKASLAEQNADTAKLLAQGNAHNFIQFAQGSTLPEGTLANSRGGEHMYSFDYAYLLEPARDWLFQQHR
ncbi:alpha/beta hydrolase-fold protein [Avibacterium paragallinarum]|uniref:Phospholipase/carboxylesterase n=1 Tax=Avibacterium paragallinarum TaxID=728 RepID=A0A377I9Q1_AVIPA|nr:alpha/beta hydrolase-fold protein [Avibacterium paragallinarum]POY46395.1 pyrroline-5-carboxylate reductase [Avibacterium paragallinarum]CDF99551.1 Putative Pyrroline-5-carboxylate reductase [Avibacterium paragallinarum JF4211]STO72054.1 phospholipase/carboxylesterase [Avibacterium paragallinarum]